MTRARKAVLDILAGASEPLSAGEIRDSLLVAVDQATVYRTLHYLEENGFADSFILHCAAHGTERFYTAAADADGAEMPHRHWFHCEACHEFIDLGDCGLVSRLDAYESRFGIEVKTHTLYLTGICSRCRGPVPGTGQAPANLH